MVVWELDVIDNILIVRGLTSLGRMLSFLSCECFHRLTLFLFFVLFFSV